MSAPSSPQKTSMSDKSMLRYHGPNSPQKKSFRGQDASRLSESTKASFISRSPIFGTATERKQSVSTSRKQSAPTGRKHGSVHAAMRAGLKSPEANSSDSSSRLPRLESRNKNVEFDPESPLFLPIKQIDVNSRFGMKAKGKKPSRETVAEVAKEKTWFEYCCGCLVSTKKTKKNRRGETRWQQKQASSSTENSPLFSRPYHYNATNTYNTAV